MILLIFIIGVIYIVIRHRKPRSVVKSFEVEYSRYLDNLGDKNFLCYNNRKKLKGFIELDILPYLPEDVDIIFLKGKEPVSDYPSTVISALLYRLKDYDGFPHLVKLRNGQQYELSVNNEIYNCIEHGKPVELVLWKIYDFFELTK